MGGYGMPGGMNPQAMRQLSGMPGGVNPMNPTAMRALPTLHTQFGMKGQANPTQLMAPIPVVDSPIVIIKVVFQVDADTDDTDFAEVADDMKQGCSAHGTLLSMVMVTP